MVPPTSGDDNDAPPQQDLAAEGAHDSGDTAHGSPGSVVAWSELPGPLNARLAELAAAALATMRPGDVPAPLRPVMRFAATKRAKLGQSLLVESLRDSAVFRSAVLDWCRNNRPEALESEHADALVVASAAVLRNSATAPHYVELISNRVERGELRGERDSAVAKANKLTAEVERLRGELADAEQARDRAGESGHAEAERLRKRLREQGVRLKEAKDDAELARTELQRLRHDSDVHINEVAAQRDRELSRAREERTRAERAAAEAEIARRSAKEARQGDEMRLALLLETMEGSIEGLRRELGAGGRGPKPADTVSGIRARSASTDDIQDVAALERLLALPAVHLIVDGYNVTKTGYPELPLADQRDRLAHQLATLSARTGIEATVVFDGADVVAAPSAGPRGVRVVFSDAGVQADDVIRDLVQAEPHGRQIIVATSDRAVVTSVRQQQAYAVASAVLLERINRV